MSASIDRLHRQALDATGAIVANIRAEHMDRATPCDGWSVRDLLNHLVAGNLWAVELGNGKSIADVGDALDGDVLGDDARAAYDASASAAAAVFEQPGALERACAVSYGPVPGSVYAGHRFIDVLIHGWDLAKATDQPTDLDPTLVDECWDVLRPQLAPFQGSGAFGTEQAPKDDSPQATLLAALGREA